MIDKKTQDLIQLGATLFSNKSSLDSFLDSIALNFYPERVYVMNNYSNMNGTVYGANLSTSFPILMRRTLGEVFGSTRPKSEQWFEITTNDYDEVDNDSKAWLDRATRLQRQFIYDNQSGFTRAMAQADQDFACFGQAVVGIEPHWRSGNLIHNCYRIRDCAWQIDYAGNVNQVFRRCNLRMMDVYHLFGEKCSPKMMIDMKTAPYKLIQLFHIVMTKEDYENSYNNESESKFKIDKPFVSIVVDIINQHVIEAIAVPTLRYVIPRWVTFAGSQYALSGAVTIAIPDANLLQAMTLTMLDAAEKAASPPILAREDAVRGDIGLSANAVTVINGNYDGAVDEAIKMQTIDRSGIQFALKMLEDTRDALKNAFYINQINLKQPSEQMTAYQVSQIVKENARQLLALFQPIEEFNSMVCETQFWELMNAGAFGDARLIPNQLKGANVSFKFKNALTEAQGENKAQLFAQLQAGIAQAATLDPTVANIVDVKVAFRDALYASGTPPKWLRNEDVVAEMDAQQAQAQQTQQLIAQLGAGGQAAEQIGKGAQAVQQAGLV